MEKDIIINSPQDKTEFTFELSCTQCELTKTWDDTIVGHDARTDELLFRIPPPRAYDAAGYIIDTHFELTEQPGWKWELTKVIDSDLSDLEPDTSEPCEQLLDEKTDEPLYDEETGEPLYEEGCIDGQKHTPIPAVYPLTLDANVYSDNVFEIDTSTNVAGLTTLKGSAPDASDTLYIFATDASDVTLTIESNLTIGAVYLGQDSGASNKVYDAFIAQAENTTFNITGDFTIVNATDSSSANQYSTTGTDATLTTTLQIAGDIKNYGNFIMDDNDLVQITSDSTVSANMKGLINYGTGYLEIKGTKDDNGTSTSNTSETVIEDTSKSWTADVHNNKVVKITSGRANGKIYDITDTTSNTLVRADNTEDSTVEALYYNNRSTRITSSGDPVTANDQHISRYVKFTSGTLSGNYYQIVDSSASSDYVYVIEDLDTLGAAVSDSFTITDGLASGDTYEIYDYAEFTATTQDSTHRAYIFSDND